MTEDSVLRIGHLYPGLMNLYGDRGNVLALRYRAALRGIRTEVIALDPGQPVTPGMADIYFFGGGQDAEQEKIYGDFIDVKGRGLADELDAGAACLAVCGGYQLLGHYYVAFGGKRIEGLGWLDVRTEAGQSRSIGNILVAAELGGQTFEVVGFENHGGETWLGNDVVPLGHVLAGSGNNGRDGTEGAVRKNVVATYLHGPILPKSPALTDWLIARGMSRRISGFTLEPAGDDFEQAAAAEARALTLRERGQRRDRFTR